MSIEWIAGRTLYKGRRTDVPASISLPDVAPQGGPPFAESVSNLTPTGEPPDPLPAPEPAGDVAPDPEPEPAPELPAESGRESEPVPEPAPEPEAAPEPAPSERPEYPSFVPQFVTDTGDLKPLTDDTLAEIESVLDAYQQGETPPDYEPEVQSITGERMTLSPEAIADLARLAQERHARGGIQTTREIPPDFMPFFDTDTGEMPPIIDVEDTSPGADDYDPADVVDAEWVVDIGQKLDADHPLAGHARRPGPVTQQLLEAVRLGRYGATDMFEAVFRRRWGAKQVAILLAIVGVAALAVFVPANFDRLVASLGGGPSDETPPPGAAPGPTYVVITGDPPLLTPAPSVEPTATLRPDQVGRIAYAATLDGDFEIVVLTLATGDSRVLTDNAFADRSPAWSPDGSRLVFVSDREGDDDLFVMNDDGSGVVQLTTSGAADRSPRWSPDGSQVVFTRESVTGSALMAFDASCMGQPGACEDALQTLSTGRYDLDPAWSPDGRSIVFGASDVPGNPSSLAIVDAAGGGFRTLSATGASDFDPAWSPDGRWIAFASNVFEDYDLWLVEAGGGEPRQLTRGQTTDVQPAWSPQGDWLVYATDTDGAFDLFIVEARCAIAGDDPAACEDAARRLTDTPEDDLDPAWGP